MSKSLNYDRLSAIYNFLADYEQKHHAAPTIIEIMRACQIPSKQTVFRYLRELEESRYINISSGKARGIELLDPSQRQNTEMSVESVSMNLSIPVKSTESRITKDSDYFVFPAECVGDRHVIGWKYFGSPTPDDRVRTGDTLFLELDTPPEDGQTVLCEMADMTSLRTFRIIDNQSYVCSLHRNGDVILAESVNILGIVRGSYRDFYAAG